MEDDYIVRMPPVREYTVRAKIKSVEKGVPCLVGLEDELAAWDKLSDEALEEFEKLVEESESGQPITFLDKIRYWTLSDWIDWLMGR